MKPFAAAALLAVVTAGCAVEDETETQVAEANEASVAFKLDVGIEKTRFQPLWEKGGDPAAWQKGSFDLGNAYWLARYAHLAYEHSEDVIRETLEAEGAKPHEVWVFENPCTGAAALYVQMRDHGVLAFRGTEPTSWADLSTDGASQKSVWRGPGLVHIGFMDQYDSLVFSSCPDTDVELNYFIDQLHGPGGSAGPLYVTGHSLGGALATLFVADAQVATCGQEDRCREAPPVNIAALYTFGSPKVGDEAFAGEVAWRAAGHTPIYRVVHRKDLVTGVPRNLNPLELTNYKHIAYPDGAEATFQVWFDAKKMVIAEHHTHLLDSITDHSVDQNYIPRLKTFAKKAKEIR
jgi:hypothetical protein